MDVQFSSWLNPTLPALALHRLVARKCGGSMEYQHCSYFQKVPLVSGHLVLGEQKQSKLHEKGHLPLQTALMCEVSFMN